MIDTDIETYEKEDDHQIVHASKELIQALVYVNKRGNKELSYTGIQWIAQRMAEHGQPLEAIQACTELVKHDPTDKSQWIWYSTAKVKNVGTGAVTIGVSESPFLTWYYEKSTGNKVYTDYDEFGRTKAHGKAMRNAMRQLIPVIEIDNMIKDCTEQQVKHIEGDTGSSTANDTGTSTNPSGTNTNNTSVQNNINTTNNTSTVQNNHTQNKSQSNTKSTNTNNHVSNNHTPNNHTQNNQSNNAPTERQINYLKALGYTGDMPANVSQASELIQDIKEKRNQ